MQSDNRLLPTAAAQTVAVVVHLGRGARDGDGGRWLHAWRWPQQLRCRRRTPQLPDGPGAQLLPHCCLTAARHAV